MGKITILTETTKNPISLIGERAGICWGADTEDPEKNYKRGLACVASNHGRTFEYVNIEMVIDGYSARVIREWYTHIGGAPTRLQASTRYINYQDFDYIIPKKIEKNEAAKVLYDNTMETIKLNCKLLEELGIPREDIGMMLPLGMSTKIVDKRNLRNLIDMSGNRMCQRAYWEYREIMNDLFIELSNYSEEWKTLIEMTMKPKCEKLGYCPEENSCGRYKKNTVN